VCMGLVCLSESVCVVVCCSVLQCITVCCKINRNSLDVQFVLVLSQERKSVCLVCLCESVCVAVCCSVLQCVAVYYSVRVCVLYSRVVRGNVCCSCVDVCVNVCVCVSLVCL